MGNWFGRWNLMAKVPVEKDGTTMKNREEDERRSSDASPSSPMKIKVRMTKKQLEELKTRAKAKAKTKEDTSEGSSELGHLIVKECLAGKLSPRVVLGQDHVLDSSRPRRLSLSTIDEEIIANWK